MSLDDSDEKIALLKEIREEARRLREGVRCVRRDLLDLPSDTTRFEAMQRRLDSIDVVLADYAEQTRLAVHYTKILAEQHGIRTDPA